MAISSCQIQHVCLGAECFAAFIRVFAAYRSDPACGAHVRYHVGKVLRRRMTVSSAMQQSAVVITGSGTTAVILAPNGAELGLSVCQLSAPSFCQ